MSHYDNAACGAVAIKSVTLLAPGYTLSLAGLVVGACLLIYSSTAGADSCPDGGVLTDIEVSYDNGVTIQTEERCVIEAPSDQTVRELRQQYPDFFVRVAEQ